MAMAQAARPDANGTIRTLHGCCKGDRTGRTVDVARNEGRGTVVVVDDLGFSEPVGTVVDGAADGLGGSRAVLGVGALEVDRAVDDEHLA